MWELWWSEYWWDRSVSLGRWAIIIKKLTPTLYNVFLLALQFYPVSIIPPMFHTHSVIYHRRCIMFFSQNFRFPCQYHSTNLAHSFSHLPPTLYNVFLPVLQFPCQYHSTNVPYSFSHLPPTLCNVFLPVLQFPLLSIIPPMLHTHSFIYHRPCVMFFSQYFSFPCQYHSTNTPYSFFHHRRCIVFSMRNFVFMPATLGDISESVKQKVLSLNTALLYSLCFTQNAGIINKRL
jgi:hypothetical protein